MTVIAAELKTQRFVGSLPGSGIVGGIATDGSTKVVLSWDPLTGDTTLAGGSGSGTATNRVLLSGTVGPATFTSITTLSINPGGALLTLGGSLAAVTASLGAGAPDNIAALTIGEHATLCPYAVRILNRAGTQAWAFAVDSPLAGDKTFLIQDYSYNIDALRILANGGGIALGMGMMPLTTDAFDLGVASTGRWRNAYFSGAVTAHDFVVGPEAGTLTDGSMSKHAAAGLVLTGVAGSLFDFTVVTPSSTLNVIAVPTGTRDVVLYGKLTVPAQVVVGAVAGTPADGSFWFDGTAYKGRIGGVTKTFTAT